MKTVRFFWNYFKVYKLSFVIVILMVAVATIAQALFPVFSGQAVTELKHLFHVICKKMISFYTHFLYVFSDFIHIYLSHITLHTLTGKSIFSG